MRYGNGITLEVSTQGDAGLIRLPGLTLQPIVENSVKHGFGPRGGKGTVRIDVSVGQEKATITIRDNGVGCDTIEQTLATGHGIRIVRSRLELCFGKRFSLETKSEKDRRGQAEGQNDSSACYRADNQQVLCGKNQGPFHCL